MDGKRRMLTFGTYGEANQAAKKKLRELRKGHKSVALNATQSRDALVSVERLQAHFQATGRRISLLAAVSRFVDADCKLNGRSLDEAIERYLHTEATVERKDIKKAVSDFLLADAPRIKAAEGQRSQLSPKYTYIRELQLNRFADIFPGHAVCDLTKEHLDSFIGSLDKVKKPPRMAAPPIRQNPAITTALPSGNFYFGAFVKTICHRHTGYPAQLHG